MSKSLVTTKRFEPPTPQKEQGRAGPVSLRTKYPVQFKKVIKRNILGLALIFGIWIICTYLFTTYSDAIVRPIGEAIGSERTVWSLWVTLLLGLVIWKLAYETLYFFTYDYFIDSKHVIIRRGVLAKRKIIVPFSRITDVAIDRDVLDMIFGLYNVHISTPAQDSWIYAHIDGLNQTSAEAIAEMVLDKANSTDYQKKI